MIAIYARQSVDKKDSISIQTQIDTCRDQIGSTGFCEQPVREYADKGYSGKNTDRPQFQAMMQDICKGIISVVVVYRLDRCSRSVVDFANFIQTLKKHGTDFISCSEKFDTSSPMGRAMMDISMVFAQMERETIQQRVTDAYRDRSRQGFYMGGPAPYGYEAEEIILNGIHTKRFVDDVPNVRRSKIFFGRYCKIFQRARHSARTRQALVNKPYQRHAEKSGVCPCKCGCLSVFCKPRHGNCLAARTIQRCERLLSLSAEGRQQQSQTNIPVR